MIEIDFDILKASLRVTLIWCVACFAFHFLSMIIIPKIVRNFNLLPSNIRYEYFNRNVSVIHACVMSCITAYYWIYENPSQIIGSKVTLVQALSLDIMIGYLWYDLAYELVTSGNTETIGHHVLGLISHYSSRLSNNGAAGYYSMLVYIAEASTPFLHVSWLMHQMKENTGLSFTIISGLLVVVFFLCRFLLGPYMVYHLIVHKAEWYDDHGALYWMNTAIVTLFALLNMYWFYKLVMMAIKPKKKSQKKAS